MKRMFKVIALSVGGKNNQVYKSGDVVTADNFSADADELVDKCFLEKIESDTDDVDTNDVDTDDVDTDDVDTDDVDTDAYADADADADDFKKSHIEDALKQLGIKFDSKDKKAVLWEQLFASEHEASEIVEVLGNIKAG